MTALASAFEKAGIDTADSRLAAAATRALQACDGNPLRAIGRFGEIIDTDRDLRRALALSYLKDRAQDMRGASLREISFGGATPDRVRSGEGHCCFEAQLKDAPATSEPIRDDAGLKSCETQKDHASVVSKPLCSDGGQSERAPQPNRAPVAAKPNAPRGLAAIASVQPSIAKSVLDTFRVRDGRAIGDICWHELEKLARSNEAEARVLRYVASHVANAPAESRVRDIVKASVVEQAIQHSEAINAAA